MENKKLGMVIENIEKIVRCIQARKNHQTGAREQRSDKKRCEVKKRKNIRLLWRTSLSLPPKTHEMTWISANKGSLAMNKKKRIFDM